VFELSSDLVDRAAELARDVDLVPTPSDDDADFAEVLTGTNVCADEFWHGGEVARQVEWLDDQHDAGQYRVTDVEDAGTATALERFDMLDQYLSIRGVSNYDRPTDDRTPRENVFSQEFESGFEVGVENSVAVGRAIVEDRLS
jgi:purine nucleoside permease